MSNLHEEISLADNAFRKQFEYDYPVREVTTRVAGYDFICIGNRKSGLKDVHIQEGGANNSAFVSQIGDITIVNPDRTAKIASVYLMHHAYLWFYDGQRPNVQAKSTQLRIFPRDPNALADGVRDFGNEVQRNIPSADFLYASTNNYLQRRCIHPPHRALLEKHLEAGVSEYGLEIQTISSNSRNRLIHTVSNGRNGLFPIAQLLGSPLLSPNLDIRRAFRELLGSMFQNSQEFLPSRARRDKPLLGSGAKTVPAP